MEKNKIMHVGDVYYDDRIIGRDGKPQRMIVTDVRIATNPITEEIETDYIAFPY